MAISKIEDAIAALAGGGMVVVVDDTGRMKATSSSPQTQ